MIEKPNWIVPNHIKAAYTTRKGGVSTGPYSSFNLAEHVGDDRQCVDQNRSLLKSQLQLPNEPIWLTQPHGSEILNLDSDSSQKVDCDATFTTRVGKVCMITTADCLPVLLCDTEGIAVAAVHCGWRSLAAGILEKSLNLFRNYTPNPIIAWMGPAIGPQMFEVKEDMRSQFSEDSAFIRISESQYLANIYAIARSKLLAQGLIEKNIYQTDQCTYKHPDTFYSYRRDKITGRMATLIWIE